MAKNTTALLSHVRKLMRNGEIMKDTIHAYIVPSADAHQSEYLAACDERRAFISNFTGSSGTAVITSSKAALWTDGRYFLQAQQQLDENWILMKDGLKGTPSIDEWLSKEVPPNGKVAVDPETYSQASWKPMKKKLKESDIELIALRPNFVDRAWAERPERPVNPVFVVPIEYAGKTWREKVALVRHEMNECDVEVLVLSALDEIAWLFNLRGADISFNPVFFSYSIVTPQRVLLFIDTQKVTPKVRQYLDGVVLLPYENVYDELTKVAETTTERIWISDSSSVALSSMFKTRRVGAVSPVAKLKAVKNEAEIAAMRNAHIKDAVTLCEYFVWLEEEVPKGRVTEVSAAEKLLEFKKEQKEFVSLSFPTISGAGPNGAVIHYHPSPETDRVLSIEEMYLCDSGAQYMDGTTDVTRTMHFGTPTQYEKDCFTRVLKGHINLSRAVFPNGTNGSRMDCLARMALWEAGLEYLHGTGHGVGAFLNVHEGPCRIAPRFHPTEAALEAGMIVTDEPGYYEDGKFGIRIENVVLVKNCETRNNYKQLGFLSFEPLTLAPIQTKLIEPNLLTKEEITWLNNYHQTTREIVGKELSQQNKLKALRWLERETQPIG